MNIKGSVRGEKLFEFFEGLRSDGKVLGPAVWEWWHLKVSKPYDKGTVLSYIDELGTGVPVLGGVSNAEFNTKLCKILKPGSNIQALYEYKNRLLTKGFGIAQEQGIKNFREEETRNHLTAMSNHYDGIEEIWGRDARIYRDSKDGLFKADIKMDRAGGWEKTMTFVQKNWGR